MNKILVPVDPADPARTREALQTAVRIYAQGPVDVHLLSVQPLLTRHVAMFFGGIELQNLQHAAGDDDLATLRQAAEADQPEAIKAVLKTCVQGYQPTTP